MRDMFIDLAIVRIGKDFPQVYQAPSFSRLDKCEAVVVETDDGEATGVVESVITINKTYDQEMINFMLKSAGFKEPLKRVLYKIKYVPLVFEN